MIRRGFELPRFYPILDTDALAKRGLDPVDFAHALAAAGVRIAQFRHKGFFGREIYSLASEVGRILRAAGARYFINDRVDLALMLGADGVHLGQEDLPPRAVREIGGEGLRIGYSTHNETQLRAAAEEPVDYVALGPLLVTSTKKNPDPTVGVAEFRRLRGLSGRPLVAIGGITRANAEQAFQAGADSVAVISDLFEPGALDEWAGAGASR